MASQTLEPSVLAEGIVFGEGPRWHQGRLRFSDMHGHRVMTVDLAGQGTRRKRSCGR